MHDGLTRVHLLGVFFSLTLLCSVFCLVREQLLREKYSLVWFLIGLFTLLMSLSKDLLDGFSALIGVDYAPSALFAILIASAYLLLLNLGVSMSRLKAHSKSLTQELGLTKLRLEELEKRVSKAGL